MYRTDQKRKKSTDENIWNDLKKKSIKIFMPVHERLNKKIPQKAKNIQVILKKEGKGEGGEVFTLSEFEIL